MQLYRERWVEVIVVTAILGVVAQGYWPSLENKMVWDDFFYLEGRPEYLIAEYWWQTLSDNFILSTNYFRPLVVGSFLFDIHLLGGGAKIFHLTNLIWFLSTCVLAYLLLRKLLYLSGQSLQWGYLGVLIFGCSPMLSEIVLWISARFDLALTFFLLLLLFFDVYLRGTPRLVAVGVAYFCASNSKEMAVAFGLVYPIWHLYLESLKGRSGGVHIWCKRENLQLYLSVIIAGVFYMLARYCALGGLYQSQGSGDLSLLTDLTRCLLVLKTLGGYFLLAFGFAQNVSPSYPLDVSQSFLGFETIIGGGVLCAIVILLRHKPIFGFILLCFILSLLPVLHIIPLRISGNYMHQRFLAFPYALVLIMLFPVCVKAVTKYSLQRVAILAMLVLIVLGAQVVRSVVPMWSSNEVLWTWVSEKFPSNALARVNLMVAISRRGDHLRAIEMGKDLLSDRSVPFVQKLYVHASIAESYFRTGDVRSMKRHYGEIFENYGVQHVKVSQYSTIYAAYARSLVIVEPASKDIDHIVSLALRLDPYNDLALLIRGIQAVQDGRFKEASIDVDTALTYMKGERHQDGVLFARSMNVFKLLRSNGYPLKYGMTE